MEPIIPPVPVEKLEAELTKDKFIRRTNYENNDIYFFSHKDSPNLMREVGRLREVTFRLAGGGTGKEVDIDAYDISDKPFYQLIVWNPKEKIILGGYRYMICKDAATDSDGTLISATSNLFSLSDKFKKEYLPYTIELGRSFVSPRYQSTKSSRKGIFALDNLWDGLGALTVEYPNIKYLFGKVTMYTSFNQKARDLILYFIKKHFPDKEKLVSPNAPLPINTSEEELSSILNATDYKEDYRFLSKKVRSYGETIPPLINSYMNLSLTMKSFGTALNDHFGDVEETGILIKIDDIYPSKSRRHIQTYQRNK